jgi:hypothetical protein
MNKQLTKKLIGIAASAALIGSVAFSGSAMAGKGGNKQGPQASAGVSTWCEISDEAAGDMTVHVTVIDKSSGEAFGFVQVATAVVQGLTKDKGPVWDDILGATASPDLVVAPDQEVTINVCGSDLGKAINAETTIILDETFYPASKAAYTAQCGDNPYTEETEGGLRTADYPNLCTL